MNLSCAYVEALGPFYTYIHYRASDGRAFYVGKGSGDRAWSDHHRNPHWHATVRKHGRRVAIAAVWGSSSAAFEHERLLISFFRGDGQPLCNMTDGGEGGGTYVRSAATRRKYSLIHKGKTVSDETRRKISASKRGIKHGPLSDETKAKISAFHKGRGKDAVVRVKISEALKGRSWSDSRPRTLTPEHRAALSAAKRGKPWSAARRAAVKGKGGKP